MDNPIDVDDHICHVVENKYYVENAKLVADPIPSIQFLCHGAWVWEIPWENATWTAHGYRTFYCNPKLNGKMSNLQIQHISNIVVKYY